MDIILRWLGLVRSVGGEQTQRAVIDQNCLAMVCPDGRGGMLFPLSQVWPSGSNRAQFYGSALSVLF
jgi:hypothetical protein